VDWLPFEASPLRRYALAVAVSVLAAGGQWLLYPFTQGRIPFLLFVPAVVAVAAFAGRGPALWVMLAGAIAGALQMAPVGSLAVFTTADRLSLTAFGVTGILLVLIGHELGTALRQQYEDLSALHDLSVRLIATSTVEGQAELILRTLARIHGVDQGLMSTYDPRTNRLQVLASIGFSPAALETLRFVKGGEGACGLACLSRIRVVVENVMQDERFAPFRDLAKREAFQAVHSTPLLNSAGEILGAISVHFRTPPPPHRARDSSC
jgi:GAF domain-containing protein